MSNTVFVHSAFRSGSSWLREKFRASSGTLVLGEVFHELFETLDAGTATYLAPGSWNSRHPEAAPYFVEFVPLLRPGGGIAGYSADMAFERYFPKDGRLSEEEQNYIQLLIEHCQKNERVPVLSCTRTLGRLKQLKDAFGGKHILLTRDPFQQWCSYTEQAANGNPYFLSTNELILKSALDAGWLNIGNPDSAVDFLSLQAMQKHLVLHLKLYDEAASAADIVLNYELLESEEYRSHIRKLISTECGLDLDLSDFRSSNQFSLIELPSERVLDDSLMPFLPSSDRMHPEVVRLYRAMQNSMRSYAGQAGELVTFTRQKLGDLVQANEQLQSALDDRRAVSTELESRIAAAQMEAKEARDEAAAASRDVVEAHRREADAAARMVEAAQRHAAQIHSLAAEHGSAQDELRRELTRTSDDLLKKLQESESGHSSARVELARMEERAANLESTVTRLTSELGSNRAASEQTALNWSRELEQQRATLRETLSALARADALIRAARDEKTGPWKLVGQAIGLSRPPQSLRALFAWKVPATSAPAESPRHETVIKGKEESMISPGSKESRNPYLRANSLPELLAWEDVDFVRCAYVTVLGRQPDPMGEAHFTNRIRIGDSKYAVLWHLRRSGEAHNHDPGIAGFDRALKREALRRNRLFGWIIRAAVPGEGTSKQDRRFRQLRNMLAVISVQHSHQSQAAAAIQTLTLEKIAGCLAQLSDHLAASQSRQASSHAVDGKVVSADHLQRAEQARVTDDLDLSSRERAILSSIQSARY
jgi:hypothetical protein